VGRAWGTRQSGRTRYRPQRPSRLACSPGVPEEHAAIDQMSDLEFHEPRPGWAFKPSNGALIRFEKNRIAIFKAHPPQAWVKRSTDPIWRPFRGDEIVCLRRVAGSVRGYRSRRRRASHSEHPVLPGVSIAQIRGFRPDQRYEAMERFLAIIPAEILREVTRFRSRSWQMYCLLKRCPGALELTASNRALGFMLGNLWVFGQGQVRRPMRSVRALIPRRRREIAAYLGFPGTNATVRCLRRVSTDSLTVPRLLDLRDAMATPEVVRRLGFIPRINSGVIRIVRDPIARSLVTQAFLTEVGETRTFDRFCDVPERIREAADYLRFLGCSVPSFQSIGHLVDVFTASHEKLVSSRRAVDLDLGDPPVRGIPGVVEPLTTARDLQTEAREQHNCIGNPEFLLEILRGQLYVYRILEPERCTLALRPDGYEWRIGELKAKANREAPGAAYESVEAWLASASGACDRRVRSGRPDRFAAG